jgi:phosphoglucan,water dikinase
MVSIGNQTTCWATRLTDPFDFALEHGFNAFEWFPDKKPNAGWDETDLGSAMRTSILDRARTAGMRLSVHARWQANPLPDEAREFFSRDIELARGLGAVLLNIHLEHERGIAAFVEAILPLVSQTANAGLQLAIENTPHHAPEQFNELFERLRNQKQVATGHVGMCLDMGHANLSSATLNNYLAFFDRLGSHVPIIHAHLHENWGDSDSHLTIFSGPSARNDAGIRGLVSRLKGRGFSGSLILEQWPEPPSLLITARERLLLLWGPNEPPPEQTREPHKNHARVSGEPAGEIVDKLIAGDRHARSWREKLEMVANLIARPSPVPTLDDLVFVAIYLRFLSAGQIVCEEDGRHFRPGHHSRLASQIYERLAGLRTPENEFVLRKIYPSLPSSSETFQRPEPLTRIRDIAHRNDIDQDLKKEIKNRLQNKLHRCAGPEDLETSSEILKRITAPGTSYSPEFVRQFQIFHQELKEFFNARSLEERLQALTGQGSKMPGHTVEKFLKGKDSSSLPEMTESFRKLTELRQLLANQIADAAGANFAELLMADIALVDFSFSLLSRIINAFEQIPKSQANAVSLEMLICSLTNLRLSAIDPLETSALESEIRGWAGQAPFEDRGNLLRLRASLLRCRRLAEQFGARTLALFSNKAERLGRELQVSENSIRVFAEADIRSHLVFQVSKLCDRLLREISSTLNLSPWDVMVQGTASGTLVILESLEGWAPADERPTLLLLKHASGDEEIPKAVAGIALSHEMPHLAHLSVRARQAGVVFATCEDSGELARLTPLAGHPVTFVASPETLKWAAGEMGAAAAKPPANRPASAAIRLDRGQTCVAIENVTREIAGGKCYGARRLAEIARHKDAGFLVPQGLAIPFGVMQSALDQSLNIAAEYRELRRRINSLPRHEFARAAERLAELARSLPLPEAILTDIQRAFGNDAFLVVRSSANGEDLEEFAGAGLYDSRINVPAVDISEAIRSVWGSLWTPRAAESRRAAGFPHEQAHMAILVQKLISPDYSFVLHTVDPVTGKADELYAELVVGLGETLASAAVAGSPYRARCNKKSGGCEILGYANFSQATRPLKTGGMGRETVDYSKIDLSMNRQSLENLCLKLGGVGAFVEKALNGPQDIEGAGVKDQVYLVQSRAQQGLQTFNR